MKFLESISLFENIPAKDAEKILSVCKNVKFGRGDVIVREGDIGDALYVIESGSVAVTKGAAGRQEVLSILEKGSFFGEMSLLTSIPRSATVTALEPSTLVTIHRNELAKCLAKNEHTSTALYKNFAITLAKRLTVVTDKMYSLSNDAEKIRASIDDMTSEILSILSHELRTPVTVIQGAADLLEDSQSAGNEQQKKLLGFINTHTHRLTRLMDDLVQMAEVRFGGAGIKKEACDMAALLEDIAAELKAAADSNSVTMEFSISGKSPTLPVDRSRMKKALFHLIENGIKFNRKGGKLAVSADSSGDKTRFVIAIKDDGPGIPCDLLSGLAACFVQQKKSMDANRAAGLGLGLPLASSIIKAHGGELEFQSPATGGLVVVVRIPVK